MFEIEYYRTPEGRCPVETFIDGLDMRMKAKVFGRLELLEEYGPRLGMPFSRPLEDGILELRTVQGNDITRILYFFVVGERIVLTNGFVKKTQKTPSSEMGCAKRYRADWRKRNE